MASVADDGDDYEVIYSNTPLYWSMVDAGLEGVGENDVHDAVSNTQRTSGVEQTQTVSTQVKSLWGRILALVSLKDTGSLLQVNYESKSELQEARKVVLATLANSALLTEEDAKFLHDLISDQHLSVGEKPSIFHRREFFILATVTVCLLFLAVSPWLSSCPWLLAFFNTILVISLPVSIVQALQVWRSSSVRAQCKRFERQIEDALKTVKGSMDIAAKCVRFIQEMELIARGFTFVSNPAAGRILNEVQAACKQRQCPLLRQKLFCTSKVFFSTMREAFAQLVRAYPVDLEICGVVRYCSEIPLAQYPEVLQLETQGVDTLARLHDMTDGFSVDVLKSLQELNRIHASEFVRRLAVCFATDPPDGKEFSPFASLTPILETLTHTLTLSSNQLHTHLLTHRQSAQTTSTRRETTRWQGVSASSQLQNTYMAVHSLELHLLAALKKIQDVSQAMEEKMEEENTNANAAPKEKKTGERQNTGIEDLSSESWNQRLLMVKSEMAACTGCLDESFRLLLNKTNSDPKGPKTTVEKPSPVKQPVKVVTLSAEDSPIILDEVFEAYSEPQNSRASKGTEFTSAEEEAWLKKRKLNLKLCLGELQSIIDVKAAERQEREQMAVHRMMQSAMTPVSFDLSPQTIGQQEISLEDALKAATAEQQSGESERKEGALGEEINGDSAGDEDSDERTLSLADDIEERVQFWKQFDLMEQATTPSTEEEDVGDRGFVADNKAEGDSRASTQRIHNTETSAERFDTAQSDSYKCNTDVNREIDNITITTATSEGNCGSKSGFLLVTSAGKSPLESPDSDFSIIPESISTSTSHESDFIVIQDRNEDTETLTSECSPQGHSLTLSWLTQGYQDSSATDDSVADKQKDAAEEFGAQSDIGSWCEVSKVKADENSGSSEEGSGSKSRSYEGGLRSKSDPEVTEENQSLQSESTTAHKAGLSEEMSRSRSRPEGTEEHLSMPSAPSPFAFSIATMVANRAKSLAQAEDTFGDSSSDEQDEGERKEESE